MRFNKKRLIAIVVFLLLSFFMITFGNPVENTAIVTRNLKFIDGYNDKLLAEKIVELGKAVTAPTVPEHRNYVFVNWYNESTDEIANLEKIMENSTFIAKYADDRNNNGVPDDEDDYYTVRFIDGLNNDLLKSQRVLVGLDAVAPIVPTHEGYTFSNWDNNFENVTRNITVTGLFNINSYQLTINYNYAKDNSKASTSYNGVYTYNSNYSVTSPLIAGYTADKLNINGIIPANNQTFEVLYYANKDTAYKVEHYKENLDGTYTLVQTDDMAGETDTLTAALGQTYMGFTAKPFAQLNINGDGSTIIKIYYDRNSYEITYKVDGEIYTTTTLKYGETIIPEVKPSRIGYTFCGWSYIPSKMPANDLEVTGSFKVNKYILSIYYQNEYGLPMATPYINIVNYGSNYNITSNNIAGYTVDKPVVSGTMPANDKIIFVTYVANRNTPYKVEYYKNNVLFETEYKTGTTDTIVSTSPNSNKYNGYYYDILNYRNNLIDTIDGDGSTVLKVYYRTYNYVLNYNSNRPSGIVGVSSTPSARTYTVEDEFNITATMSSTSHNFIGWYSNSSGTGSAITKIEEGTTGNKTLYAKWDIKKYTVTFNEGAHGELSSTSTPNVPYNSTFGSITKPLVTPDAGYTFSGWSIAANTRITSDRTATALYTANTNTAYKVEHYTENLTSGYTLIDTENKTGITDTQTSAAAKTLTGFTVQAFSQENINGNGSTVVEIYYSRDSYTLTYKPENGSDDITSLEKYGASISAPLVSKTGYTFNAWTPSVPSTMPASDSVYTASWTINTYTLTFIDTTGASILRYVDWDNTLTDIPTITPKTGYICVWDEDNFTNITSNDTIETTCDTINYTVEFKINDDGVVGASHSNVFTVYNINTALYTIADATSTSDNFIGWFTEPVGGTQVTTLAGGAIGNVQLYAHWSKKAYTVDFEENGGTQVLPLANVYYGSTIVEPEKPTRLGFGFNDWYKEETLANKWLFATDTVTRDLTLYANWKAETYNLVFNINDSGIVGAINPSNESLFTIADNLTFNNATSTSHDFLGWFTTVDNSGMKVTGITAGSTTGDQTYYAHWSVKTSNLTVDANGGVWTGTTSQTLSYGSSVTIENPTKDGYTFIGWTLTGNGSALVGTTFIMGSEDATLTANWTVRTDLTYTIYYKLEGTTTDIQSSDTIINKTFGETYIETAPEITGYQKLDTTKSVLVTTGTNEIMFYYRAIPNITASLTSSSNSGSSVVSYGDTITYTLTAPNTGTGAGTLTAKDLLLMAELSGLDIELINTGLTSSEIADRNALLSNSGLVKTINAGNTYTLVFKVKVLGNAGSTITNKLTYNVGSDPELTDTLKNYNIEKTISLRAISEIGVNVVLTLDISGSMEGSKFSSMKSAATTFIDTIFPSGVDNEGTEICVVTFSKPWWDLFGNNASLRGCTGGSGAKTPAQLKSIINGLEIGSSTPYTSAFSVVSDTLDSMESRNTDNDNIVVFLSDGEPTDGNGYIATANALKASGTVIYSIGFEVTGSAETTLRSLATSSSYYYTGTVSNIESVFSNIASDISTETKRSINGVVEISNVDTTKSIEFKINGSTSGYPTTVANALSQSYLINNGTTYSLDLTKFSASSSVEFTYYQN